MDPDLPRSLASLVRSGFRGEGRWEAGTKNPAARVRHARPTLKMRRGTIQGLELAITPGLARLFAASVQKVAGLSR